MYNSRCRCLSNFRNVRMFPILIGIVYTLNSYQQKMTQNDTKPIQLYTQIHKVRKITEYWSETKHQIMKAETLEDVPGKPQGLFMEPSNDVLNLRKKHERLIQNHSGNFKRMEIRHNKRTHKLLRQTNWPVTKTRYWA